MKTLQSIPVVMLLMDAINRGKNRKSIAPNAVEQSTIPTDFGIHWSIWWPPHYV